MARRWRSSLAGAAALVVLTATVLADAAAQQASLQLGGSYSAMDARRQRLIDDWVTRFNEVTGQKVEPGPFYDTFVKLSSKTTFDAITHALMTTALTDASGGRLGDALDLVERIDSVRGQVANARGDQQFRMYVQLRAGATDTLERSREFRRGADNTVYHKGYPTSYREQDRTPSIQFSIAPDGRRADIDVDYRSSGFPAAIFNGHLTSSNSDVRAGNNYDRHNGRWTGLENWWRSFFGIRLPRSAGDAERDPGTLPTKPRAGDKDIDVMVHDFLTAWLIEGNAVATQAYVSPRAYACLAIDAEDPSTFDPGMAPFQLLAALKAAHEAIGRHETLEGLTVGVRLTLPGLKTVTQPHHAQFVLYAVPDDIAAALDCESRLQLVKPKRASRVYGNYFGATLNINGPKKGTPLALLWAKDDGYWKIVSWQAEPEADDPVPPPVPPSEIKVERVMADASLVQATHGFLESWLIRRNYDAAFHYLAPASYGCYNLVRNSTQAAAASPEEAGRRIRAALEETGKRIGRQSRLEDVVAPVDPVHSAVRVMDHRYSRAFTIVGLPDAWASAVGCDGRARGERVKGDAPPEYGKVFATALRLRTQAGEPPVLRLLWLKDGDAWRITAYDVEVP
jgi:hypothetical protein